jgi:5'-nucleotidase
MRRIDRRHLLPGAAAFAAAFLVALLGLNAGADEPAAPPVAGTVELQLLGVNDFHGHLEPPEPGLGGAAWLGAHLDRAADSHPDRTITVHAGDMIGASPLISSHFQDEPAIEATNMMGFDVGAVGNHEFDEGGEELMRVLQRSRYRWLAANTVDPETGTPVLPPYEVIERAGVRVGFIGVTTDDTPTWLLPEFKREYRFLDISEAVNRWVPELRSRGVEAIVVLAHSGAFQEEAVREGAGWSAPERSPSAVGEIADETAQMDDAVDVVVAGHTHSELNFTVENKLVVESLPYGTGYDRVSITVDRVTDEIVRKSAELASTSHTDVAPDPELAGFVAGYAERVAPIADRVVGELDEPLDADGLGELVADAQRAFAGADVAFVNPGNTRRPGMDAGPVSYAEAFLVHAYEHPVVRMTMSGRDVLAVWRRRGSVELYESGLEAVRPEGTYTVAANAVLASGSRFRAFERARNPERVGTDLEALVAWLDR